jgi:anti-sigma regulatory factor (Ser/Thr protein kinase)
MPDTACVSLTLPAKIDALTPCIEFIAARASEAGFPPARVAEIELVVEEVVANICRYGYGDMPGNVEIRCQRFDSGLLLLEFIDAGRPFDILALPSPDLTADLDHRDVGGLGVPLVRALVDQANYSREGDRNILRLTVRATR